MGRQSVFCQIFYSLSQLKRASLENTGCGSFIVSFFILKVSEAKFSLTCLLLLAGQSYIVQTGA